MQNGAVGYALALHMNPCTAVCTETMQYKEHIRLCKQQGILDDLLYTEVLQLLHLQLQFAETGILSH